MDDVKPVKDACEAAEALKKDVESINADEEEQKTPQEILDEIKKIGVLITDGANSFLIQEYLYLSIFSGAFSVLLGLTVDW